MIREQVTCKGCGVLFESHQRNRLYCTLRCRYGYLGALGGFCSPCKTRSGEMSLFGVDQFGFAGEHEACRRELLDSAGRDDDCRCVDCKKRLGITVSAPKRPATSKRRVTSHHKYRQLVLERDGYICQICGLPTDPTLRPADDRFPTLDHIIEVSDGGLDEPDNLRTAHRWCNSARNGVFGEEWVAARAQEMFKNR